MLTPPLLARHVHAVGPRAPDHRLGSVRGGPHETHAAQGFVGPATLPGMAVELGFEGVGPEQGTRILTRRCQIVMESAKPASLLEPRAVGRQRLPSTVLGLLYHAAEHATRHTGQAVTTTTILRGGAPTSR